MKCVRCKSPRLIRFVDGFGKERIFCRDCWNSLPVMNRVVADQKRLQEFSTLDYKVNVPTR